MYNNNWEFISQILKKISGYSDWDCMGLKNTALHHLTTQLYIPPVAEQLIYCKGQKNSVALYLKASTIL